MPTGDNPADDITRGLHPVELNLSSLTKQPSSGQKSKVEVPLEEGKRERKRLRWVGVSQESELVLGWKRYSSLAKLRRVLAYVMRFARNTRIKKELRQTGSLTATELRAAQNQLMTRAEVEPNEHGQKVHK